MRLKLDMFAAIELPDALQPASSRCAAFRHSATEREDVVFIRKSQTTFETEAGEHGQDGWRT